MLFLIISYNVGLRPIGLSCVPQYCLQNAITLAVLLRV